MLSPRRLKDALFQALAARDKAAQRPANVESPANMAIDLMDMLISGEEASCKLSWRHTALTHKRALESCLGGRLSSHGGEGRNPPV